MSGASTISGITHDGTYLWVSANGKTLYQVNDSTGAIVSQFTTANQGEQVSWNPWRGELILQYDSSADFDCFDTLGVLRGKGRTFYSGTYARPQIAWLSAESTFQAHSNGGPLYEGIAPAGSRVLLPSPVVKSSLQTMKLTYTFTYA